MIRVGRHWVRAEFVVSITPTGADDDRALVVAQGREYRSDAGEDVEVILRRLTESLGLS